MRKGVALCVSALLLTELGFCQPADKKASVLHGTVEKVDTASKKVSVANEAIAGGMGAMTMSYSVEKEEALGRLKPGDRISAKYYEGVMTLYDLQVMPPPSAGTVPGLSLEELERIAISNNPTLAQAGAGVRAAAGMARQAGLYPNPSIGYYGDEIRGGYTGGGKQGGFISQTIVTGGKLQAARRAALIQSDQAATTGEIQRLRILNDVRMMFYRVLANQRMVDVRQNLAQLAADAAQTSHQLANVGQADQQDVLQAELEQQQVDVALRVARQTLQASWRTLAATIGKPELAQTRLEGDLDAIPDVSYDATLAAALRESPELKLAQQALKHADAALLQAKKAPIPDLQLSANLTQNYEPLETTRRPTGVNAGVQIGVAIPIFNRNQGNIAAAKAEIENAKAELLRIRLQLGRQMANLFSQYESARITVRQYKDEVLPRAEKAYQLYQTNYRRMAGAYPQALISQRTLFQLQVDYVQALESVWQGVLSLRGFGLTDGLTAPLP